MKRRKLSDFLTACVDLFRRLASARMEALSQRQKIEDQIRQDAGAAADVTAIIEDLPLQLFDERILRFFELPVVPGDGKIGEDERDQADHPRNAVRRIAPRRLQRDDLLADARHDLRCRTARRDSSSSMFACAIHEISRRPMISGS